MNDFMKKFKHIIKYNKLNNRYKEYLRCDIEYLYYFSFKYIIYFNYKIKIYFIFHFIKLKPSKDCIFDLSNILYKIHNPNYYRKYNHKELI